jgi:hypothetical protein
VSGKSSTARMSILKRYRHTNRTAQYCWGISTKNYDFIPGSLEKDSVVLTRRSTSHTYSSLTEIISKRKDEPENPMVMPNIAAFLTSCLMWEPMSIPLINREWNNDSSLKYFNNCAGFCHSGVLRSGCPRKICWEP